MGITNMANTFPGFLGPQVAKAIAVEVGWKYNHTLLSWTAQDPTLPSIQPNAPKGSKLYLDGYRDEWREVFIIAAEIYIFGAIAYLILASGEKQPWADGRRQKHIMDKQDSVKLDRDTDRPTTSIQ